MTQERKAILHVLKDGKYKVEKNSEVKLNEASATVADLKATGYAKLFDADKYVKERDEVICFKPNVTITDATLVSDERSFEYHLYVTTK